MWSIPDKIKSAVTTPFQMAQHGTKVLAMITIATIIMKMTVVMIMVMITNMVATQQTKLAALVAEAALAPTTNSCKNSLL